MGNLRPRARNGFAPPLLRYGGREFGCLRPAVSAKPMPIEHLR